jgi:vanillate O-demethylase monooxygenase subunit
MFPGVGDHAAIMLRSELFGVALINGVGTQTLATDAQGESRRCVGSMNFLHGVTPATDTTTHYFTAMTRDFALNDDALWRVLEQRNLQVAREDVAMLEAIEPHLEAHGDSDAEVNFMADAAAMRVRRRIQRLITQEANARVPWDLPLAAHAAVL